MTTILADGSDLLPVLHKVHKCVVFTSNLIPMTVSMDNFSQLDLEI